MRRREFIALSSGAVTTWSLSALAQLKDGQSPMQVTVEDGWSCATDRVREAVAPVQLLYIDLTRRYPRPGVILIRPNRQDGPRTLDKKGPNGETIITLSEVDGYAPRLTFQCAHEFCHVTCNYDTFPNNGQNPHHWMEEALCGAAELFVLASLGFRDYRDRVVNDLYQPYGELSGSFKNWYHRHETALVATKALEPINRPLALHLATRFRDGEFISAARYLYSWPMTRDFLEHLENWIAACPAELKTVPTYLRDRFSI
jgi:hypothetical protein